MTIPVTVKLSVSGDLRVQSIVGLGSEQNVSYGLYIILGSYTTSVQEVMLTNLLPANLNFVSATPSGKCIHADGIMTCNLGTVTRYYPDHSALVRIYARPEIAGQITITGKIKAANANETTFSQTKVVSPSKSRKRVRIL